MLTWILFIGKFVHPVEGEEIGVDGIEGGIVILARCMFHFIREYKIITLSFITFINNKDFRHVIKNGIYI